MPFNLTFNENWPREFVERFNQLLSITDITLNKKAFQLVCLFSRHLNERTDKFSSNVNGEATLLYYCLHQLKITDRKSPESQLYREVILLMLENPSLDIYLQFVTDKNRNRSGGVFYLVTAIESLRSNGRN